MVGVFGVAGNILTVFVLKRIDQNSTFNRLLTFLAIVDTLLLSYYVLDMGLVGTFIRSQPGCEGKIDLLQLATTFQFFWRQDSVIRYMFNIFCCLIARNVP